MCCGRKRAAWRSASAPVRAPSPSAAAQGGTGRPVVPGARVVQPNGGLTHAPFGAVTLEYTETAPIRVWGPATGLPYDFSDSQRVHAMDARDAAALARSSLFRRTEA